jgi:hypothetical protein
MDNPLMRSSNSEPFKSEDPLMSRLREILLQQELIEKRLKESRILASQPLSPSHILSSAQSTTSGGVAEQPGQLEMSSVTEISLNEPNMHDEKSDLIKPEVAVLVEKKDEQKKEDLEKEHEGEEEKKEDERAESVLSVNEPEPVSSEQGQTEETVQGVKAAAAEEEEDKATVEPSSAEQTLELIGEDSAVDLNVSQNLPEINVNQSNSESIDEVDRADHSVESSEPIEPIDEGLEKTCETEVAHLTVDSDGSIGGGQNDSAFGDSVESFNADLDTSVDGSERTVSTAASPEPFVLHDENNNQLIESAPEIELIIRVRNQLLFALITIFN